MFIQLSSFPDYMVNDCGVVVSLKHKAWRERKVHVDKHGYLKVMLLLDAKAFSRSIHQLVMEAFVGPRPEGYDINHKNGVKTDNRIENLEYCTKSQNTQHAWDTGLAKSNRGGYTTEKCRGSKNTKAKLTESQALEILSLKNSGLSSRVVAAKYNLYPTAICKIWRGDTWRHLHNQEVTNAAKHEL